MKEKLKLGTFNDGFIEEVWPADWLAGLGALDYIVNISTGDWRKFRSANQLQFGNGGDKLHCVSRAKCNVIEAILNFKLQNGTLPQVTVDFLTKNNYLVDGKVELNVRFLAQKSGTTKQGNSISKVADSGREFGYAPKNFAAYPDDVNLTWDEYYVNPPAELVKIALDFNKHLKINEEWVLTGDGASEQGKQALLFHLKQSPLQVASPLCPPWNIDEVPACALTQSTHSYIIDYIEDKKALYAFDHYEPFTKKLPWNYYLPYAQKTVITPLCTDLPKDLHPKGGPGSLLKVIGKPAIYMYGFDKKWHGIANMQVHNIFKGLYDPTKVIREKEMPSNVGCTLTIQDLVTNASEPKQGNLLDFILKLFNKK